MKILVDMNLSPDWCKLFAQHQIVSAHWNHVGPPNAPDKELMDWAIKEQMIIFTHDIDFGMLLALTQAKGPSVLLLRSEEVRPTVLGDLIIKIIHTHKSSLSEGALIVLDLYKTRIRMLPLQKT